MESANSPQVKALVSDVAMQKTHRVDLTDPERSVEDLVQELLDPMSMPRHDSLGAELTYFLHSDREGRKLSASERVVDAVQPGDRLTLLPDLHAGLFA